MPDASPKLEIAIAPYIWIPSFEGTQTIRGIDFDVSVDFADIFNEADSVFGLMGTLDLKYDRLVFQLDGAWSTAEFSDQRGVARNGEVSGELGLDTTWIESFAGYRVIDRPLGSEPTSHRRLSLDAFVGGRVTLMDIDTTISTSATITLPDGDVLNPGESREKNETQGWIEPFVGLRFTVDLTEHWVLNFRGDIGGFGLGSDFAWQAGAVIGYRWRRRDWNIGLFGGYRALGQDYSNDDFGWDMVVHGPIIGVQISF